MRNASQGLTRAPHLVDSAPSRTLQIQVTSVRKQRLILWASLSVVRMSKE